MMHAFRIAIVAALVIDMAVAAGFMLMVAHADHTGGTMGG